MQDESKPAITQWSKFKAVVQTAVSEHLGVTNNKKCDWISKKTMELSDQARDARLNRMPDFKALRREVSRSAREDRNKYWEDMACKLETASKLNNFRQLFRLLRQVSSKPKSDFSSLRNLAGQSIASQRGRLQRWVEHFEGLLNHSSDFE